MTKNEIKLQREAFIAGSIWRYYQMHPDEDEDTNETSFERQIVEKQYPFPKKTIARIVTDRNGVKWSFSSNDQMVPVKSTLLMANWGNGWKNDSAPGYPSITREITSDLAPLFNNPTEEVDDD